MFTVKATYRNETRKFTFTESSFQESSFPSYQQLCNQLYRVFPISHNYYLSKLLFSPDSSKPARILVGKEVYSAEDYDKAIAPLQGRLWTSALLKFSVFDDTPHKAPSTIGSEMSFDTIGSTVHDGSRAAFSPGVNFGTPLTRPQSFVAPSPSPFAGVPPPPIIFSSPHTPRPHGKMDVDASSTSCPEHTAPNQSRSCCSVSQGRDEMHSLLTSFKSDLDRIITTSLGPAPSSGLSGRSLPPHPIFGMPSSQTNHPSITIRAPKRYCPTCMNMSEESFYQCEKCIFVMCNGCFNGGVMTQQDIDVYGNNHTFKPEVLNPAIFPSVPPTGPCTPEAPAVTPVPILSQPATRSPVPTSAPVPAETVIHNNIVCDECNEIVVGVRHKCLDCPDYDLCTPCIEKGSAVTHNPFHEFFDIEEPGRVIVHTVFSGDGERAAAPSRGRSSRSSNTQAAQPVPEVLVRHRAHCDLCDSRIEGVRYKCGNCPDFDTCASCFAITPEQHPYHVFLRLSKADDYIPSKVPIPASNSETHYATCDGCQKRITGVRYKCMHPSCPDFDLCDICESTPIPVHPPLHPMLKIKRANTLIPKVTRVGESMPSPAEPQVERDGVKPPVGSLEKLLALNPTPSGISQEQIVVDDAPNPVESVYEKSEAGTITPISEAETAPLPVRQFVPSPVMAPIHTQQFFERPASNTPTEQTTTRRSPIAEASPMPGSYSPVYLTPAPTETSSIHIDAGARTPQPFIPDQPLFQFWEGASRATDESSSCHTLSPVPGTWWDRQNMMNPQVAIAATPVTEQDIKTEVSDGRTHVWDTESARPDSAQSVRTIKIEESPLLAPQATEAEVRAETPSAPPSVTSISQFGVPPLSLDPSSDLFREFWPRVSQELRVLMGESSPPPAPLDAAASVAEASPVANEALLASPLPAVREMQQNNLAPLASLNRISLANLLNNTNVPSTEASSPLAASISTVDEIQSEPATPAPAEDKTVDITPAEPQSLSAVYVTDATVPDGQVFPPGAEFVKSWRMMNDGSTDWPETTELVFVAGERLQTVVQTVVVGAVPAGEEVDVWTGELKAPDTTGRYVSYWRLSDGPNKCFGHSIWIDITVADLNHRSDGYSDEGSLSSSSVIMPHSAASSPGARIAPSMGTTSPVTAVSRFDSEDAGSDDGSVGSSASLISIPTSEISDDDAAVWADSRSQVIVPTEQARTAMEYVVLYDEASSEDE